MNRLEQDRAAALAASKASQAKAKRENAKIRHTPGPWVVRTIDQSLATVETQDGEYIICNAAQLRGDDWKTEHAERKANARLIAAAPEMLDALDGLAAQVRPLWAELDIDRFQHSALKEAYDFACKVAGKAQGEPQ